MNELNYTIKICFKEDQDVHSCTFKPRLMTNNCVTEPSLLPALKYNLCFLTVLVLGKVTNTLELNLSTALSCAKVLLTF